MSSKKSLCYTYCLIKTLAQSYSINLNISTVLITTTKCRKWWCYTWFWVGRKLSFEVLSLQNMDKQHSCRWVDVTICVWSRQDGDHWNVDFKWKENLLNKARHLLFCVFLVIVNDLLHILRIDTTHSDRLFTSVDKFLHPHEGKSVRFTQGSGAVKKSKCEGEILSC